MNSFFRIFIYRHSKLKSSVFNFNFGFIALLSKCPFWTLLQWFDTKFIINSINLFACNFKFQFYYTFSCNFKYIIKTILWQIIYALHSFIHSKANNQTSLHTSLCSPFDCLLYKEEINWKLWKFIMKIKKALISYWIKKAKKLKSKINQMKIAEN